MCLLENECYRLEEEKKDEERCDHFERDSIRFLVNQNYKKIT